MAYLVIVINTTDSIPTLNGKIQEPTKPSESVNNCRNYLEALTAGAKDGTVQVTVRSTDPSVGTAGSGSTQNTYNLS